MANPEIGSRTADPVGVSQQPGVREEVDQYGVVPFLSLEVTVPEVVPYHCNFYNHLSIQVSPRENLSEEQRTQLSFLEAAACRPLGTNSWALQVYLMLKNGDPHRVDSRMLRVAYSDLRPIFLGHKANINLGEVYPWNLSYPGDFSFYVRVRKSLEDIMGNWKDVEPIALTVTPPKGIVHSDNKSPVDSLVSPSS